MKKFLKQIKLIWKMKFGKPNDFYFVSEGGLSIGPELKVAHLPFHDMAEWACCCRLTEEVIMNDIDANAIKITGSKMIDRHNCITSFQPCKINPTSGG